MTHNFFHGFFYTRGASLSGASMRHCAIILALYKKQVHTRSASLNGIAHMPTFWAVLSGNRNRLDTRWRPNEKTKEHQAQQSQTHTERLTLFSTPQTSRCTLLLTDAAT
jgi:hypothetical protein